MDAPVNLFWFRDDLRLADNPALSAAVRAGGRLVCCYVLDEETPGPRPLGGALRWWLAGSLRSLAGSLAARGQSLVLRRGIAASVVPALAAEVGATAGFWNERSDPAAAAVDAAVRSAFEQRGIGVETAQASLLHAPGAVLNGQGQPFRVFAPFWRKVLSDAQPRAPLPAPAALPLPVQAQSDDLDQWELEPRHPDWAGGLRATWKPGEAAGTAALGTFTRGHLADYAGERDRPAPRNTSQLSPHLRFGEISPYQVWNAAHGRRARDDRGPDKFLSELGWREFCYDVLARHPDMASRPMLESHLAFPFRQDPEALRAWQRGQTGFPIIDAAMRQLWQIGWMPNRCRMNVASFLVKDLLVDWREGERWFWDTLVDADPANNPFNWQWIAGSGVDAAPFYRVFNPVLQGEKFDPAGDYVRRFVPEIAALPDKYIHKPFAAPRTVLRKAGVEIGRDYPAPLVEHKAARDRALAALRAFNGEREVAASESVR